MYHKVYTVTVLDFSKDIVLGFRRTPAIFTSLESAIHAVINNDEDLADDVSYQYAVIEETYLNRIRPAVHYKLKRWWFKYNAVQNRFFACEPPKAYMNLEGYGIG